MRHALIALLMVASLSYLDRGRAKAWLRRTAVGLCRIILEWLSSTYPLRPQHAVVFAPHQDDETFGCGALIARKRNEGFPVHVVFITDGRASHPGHPRFSPDAIASLRRHEAREALAILGVETGAIHFLDEPDGTLRELDAARREKLVESVTELLRGLRPSEVFLPCNPDGSSEHDATFGFVMEALHRSSVSAEIWQYPVWTWWNPALLVRRIFLERGYYRLPAEDYLSIKRRAIACYRSQTEPLAPQTSASLPPDLLEMLDSGVEYFFRLDRSVGGPAESGRCLVV